MPRDGYPCACWRDPFIARMGGSCVHHAERDQLEEEHGVQAPRERDHPNNASYLAAYRAWKAALPTT